MKEDQVMMKEGLEHQEEHLMKEEQEELKQHQVNLEELRKAKELKVKELMRKEGIHFTFFS